MKYFKKLKLYKASNVVFNPESKVATSYNWWKFLGYVNGVLVFNDHKYSTTTMRHQRLVKAVLQDLGVKPDLVIDSRQSLSEGALSDAIERLKLESEALMQEIDKPRSQKKKNAERFNQVMFNSAKIKEIQSVLNRDTTYACVLS